MSPPPGGRRSHEQIRAAQYEQVIAAKEEDERRQAELQQVDTQRLEKEKQQRAALFQEKLNALSAAQVVRDDCVVAYALKFSKSQLTGFELADAALAACNTEASLVRQAITEAYRGTPAFQDVDATFRKSTERSRGIALQSLAEHTSRK